MKYLILALSFAVAGSCGSRRAEIKSLTIHSNAPFQANQAQACSLLTGNAAIQGGPKVKIEMFCADRTDFDPVKGAYASYPYTRISTVSLDAAAMKQFQSAEKWKVDLFCQDQQAGLQCDLQ
jgi:hypothetical protein